jgi:hypothetical protein
MILCLLRLKFMHILSVVQDEKMVQRGKGSGMIRKVRGSVRRGRMESIKMMHEIHHISSSTLIVCVLDGYTADPEQNPSPPSGMLYGNIKVR